MSTSSITRINTGPRLSDVTIHNGLVYLAGQVPRGTLEGTIEEQTAEVLATIDRLLGAAGSGKERILSCQIFLADIGEIARMNTAWDAWVPQGKCPCRATVQAKLANPAWRIEIVVVAALAAQQQAA
ncbi:RidA family protein [Cupriavidus sp. 2TAF22]|uniref:RidA family protein n=1 Tax=unclassified Cupriavidus TaxID=2640874 RepID=UPI003F8F326D